VHYPCALSKKIIFFIRNATFWYFCTLFDNTNQAINSSTKFKTMKKTIRRFAPAMLVLVALATLSFMAKDSITLRLRPQQGKTYTITSKATTMNMLEVQGQTVNQSQNVDVTQTLNVKEVTDEQSTFETQVESIKMTVSSMGMKFEYDSEHPEKTSPMIADQVKDFEKDIKKSTTVIYDALGNVVSEDDLNMSVLGAAIIQMPEEEISEGYQWTLDKNVSMSGMEVNSKMTYTVTSITKKSIELSVKGNVVDSSDGIKGTWDGTMSINPQTGMTTKSSMKTNISMTITEQGMSIPVTVVGTTNITVEEK
jgi:hypothetical protein